MKPRELFAMRAQEVTHDVQYLFGFYYDHIPEVQDKDSLVSTEAGLITINVIKHHNFDYRRFWRLCAVFFDGHPVMIIRNAGREGDDHASRFIVDGERYDAMVKHIASLPRKPTGGCGDARVVVPIDEDIADLDAFYGHSLGGYFERY